MYCCCTITGPLVALTPAMRQLLQRIEMLFFLHGSFVEQTMETLVSAQSLKHYSIDRILPHRRMLASKFLRQPDSCRPGSPGVSALPAHGHHICVCESGGAGRLRGGPAD